MTHLRGEHLDECGDPTAGFATLTALMGIFGLTPDESTARVIPVGERSETSLHADFLARAAVDDYETEED